MATCLGEGKLYADSDRCTLNLCKYGKIIVYTELASGKNMNQIDPYIVNSGGRYRERSYPKPEEDLWHFQARIFDMESSVCCAGVAPVVRRWCFDSSSLRWNITQQTRPVCCSSQWDSPSSDSVKNPPFILTAGPGLEHLNPGRRTNADLKAAFFSFLFRVCEPKCQTRLAVYQETMKPN